MHVDWVTTAAQLVNFLILVYLLKRFLYARVLAAMERRQARIDERLDEAARREAAARDTRAELEERMAAIDREHEARHKALEEELHTRRTALLEGLREEMAEARRHWHGAVRREQERFVRELSAESARLSLDLVGRVVRDLADTQLEARIAERFAGILDALEPEQRELVRGAPSPLVVHSAFDLGTAAREVIQAAVARVLGREAAVRFVRTRELVCGVELEAGHARIGWNAAAHLRHLESRVEEMLARHAIPGAPLERAGHGAA